jgi:hypothetical protein
VPMPVALAGGGASLVALLITLVVVFRARHKTDSEGQLVEGPGDEGPSEQLPHAG